VTKGEQEEKSAHSKCANLEEKGEAGMAGNSSTTNGKSTAQYIGRFKLGIESHVG
jgi:hypothetical protein